MFFRKTLTPDVNSSAVVSTSVFEVLVHLFVVVLRVTED